MLTPIPYHSTVAAYLKTLKPVWEFFADNTERNAQLSTWKTDLLKSTYKFDPVAEAPLYQLLTVAKDKLGLQIPVTLYQQENSSEPNASIAWLNGEAHIVFSGKLLRDLNDEEKLAVLSHELSHVLFFRQLNGDMEIADLVITSLGNNPGSSTAHYETARLFKLYTEIFCDRGSYLVNGSVKPIISSLVKIATGLDSVNPEGYIRQANEIFAADENTTTSGITHPENFIRARAIALWAEQATAAEPAIRKMIESSLGLHKLDLFKQLELQEATKALIAAILSPAWMQTEKLLDLANLYFPKYFAAGRIAPADKKLPSGLHSEIKEYFAYTIYDFIMADPDLEERALTYGFELARNNMIEDEFLRVLKNERKLTEKKLKTFRDQLMAGNATKF